MTNHTEVATAVIDGYRRAGWQIVAAESLTGGALADALVSVPGASDVFLGSVVAYSNRLKHSLLGVPEALLQGVGAVSAQSAEAMAYGARRMLGQPSDTLVAISATGVAGPATQDGRAVGTVFLGLDSSHGAALEHFQFSGDRAEIRGQAVEQALKLLLAHLEANQN